MHFSRLQKILCKNHEIKLGEFKVLKCTFTSTTVGEEQLLQKETIKIELFQKSQSFPMQGYSRFGHTKYGIFEIVIQDLESKE